MSRAASPAAGPPLRRLPRAGRWGVLLAASVLAGAALQAIRLPAALLLGPLAAAVVIQTAGGAVKIPRALMVGAQAVIGCLVARSITAPILAGFASHWLLILAVVSLSLSGRRRDRLGHEPLAHRPGHDGDLGDASRRRHRDDGDGGGLSADVPLVAFMQYLRVVMVAAVAPWRR